MSQKLAKAERKAAKEAERSTGWKIDVRPYKVRVPDFDERTGQLKAKDGKPVLKEDDFDVQGSLCDILFNRDLQLKPEEGFKAYDLAKKIRAAKTHVILDGQEMSQVRKAYDALKGISENMVEFCRRIRDAEQVKLGEVKDEAENKD